jgi:aminopeptidase N
VVHDNLPEIADGHAPVGIVYQKGGWTLHMLRGQVGSDKFWAGIREYYRRFRDGNASTADFRQVMEEVSGTDLGWFFQQWLYRAGSPAVEGAWTYNAESKKIELELAQTQAGDVFRLPLDVSVSAQNAPPKIEKIELTAKQQKFEIASEKEPASVELDPNVWILMDVKFGKR